MLFDLKKNESKKQSIDLLNFSPENERQFAFKRQQFLITGQTECVSLWQIVLFCYKLTTLSFER